MLGRQPCIGILALVATLSWGATARSADDVPMTVKVFILAGQSNREGKAPNALLDHQADDAKTRGGNDQSCCQSSPMTPAKRCRSEDRS